MNILLLNFSVTQMKSPFHFSVNFSNNFLFYLNNIVGGGDFIFGDTSPLTIVAIAYYFCGA